MTVDAGLGTSAAFVLPNCRRARDLRFAYLNLCGHPRGQLMLRRLLDAGFLPDLVIEEESNLAQVSRVGQLKELANIPEFVPAMETRLVCESHGIGYQCVTNHNDKDVENALLRGDYALAILGDTRVLKTPILRSVRKGIINIHPGVLPEVRGNNPYVWSIIHNLPQGATAHFINEGVDRGPILLCRRLGVSPTTYPQLIFEINNLCAEVLVEVMQQVVQGCARPMPQADDGRMTFREATPEIKRVAAEMLLARLGRAISHNQAG